MKKFLVLLLVAGAVGWFGWKKGWFAGHPSTPDMQAKIGGSGGQTPSSSGGAVMMGGGDWNIGDLPAEAATRFARAQARWTELETSGKTPAEEPDALALAIDFSAVLVACYGNQAKLKTLADRLVAERLAVLGQTLFFTAKRFADNGAGVFAEHTVKSGELPETIAKPYGMSPEYLNLLRGAGPDDGRLSPGDRLKVVTAKEKGYFLHADKSDFVMDLFICGVFAKRYPIGHGKDESPTPVGKARIDSREWHPKWTPPGKQPLEWDHRDNILGPVWLRLKSDELGASGIGIHGFNGDPKEATGVKASHGCIRMKNDDAIQLYRIMVRVQTETGGNLLQRAPMLVEIVE